MKYSIHDWQLINYNLAFTKDEEPLKIIIPPKQIGFATDNHRSYFTQEHGWKVVEDIYGEAMAMQVVDVQQLAHSSHAHSHVPLKAFLCFQKDVPMLAHDRNRTFSHFGTPQTLIMFNVMLLLPIHLRCRWVDSFEVLKIILVPNRLKMLFSKFCSGRLRCDLIYKNSLYKEQSRPDINSNLNTSISDDNKG